MAKTIAPGSGDDNSEQPGDSGSDISIDQQPEQPQTPSTKIDDLVLDNEPSAPQPAVQTPGLQELHTILAQYEKINTPFVAGGEPQKQIGTDLLNRAFLDPAHPGYLDGRYDEKRDNAAYRYWDRGKLNFTHENYVKGALHFIKQLALQQRLGEGGMGLVHAAEMKSGKTSGGGRKVAVKEISPAYAQDKLLVGRFIDEAENTEELTNEKANMLGADGNPLDKTGIENIIKVWHMGNVGGTDPTIINGGEEAVAGRPYYIMERGKEDLIETCKRLREELNTNQTTGGGQTGFKKKYGGSFEELMVGYVLETARGLRYAHIRGVTHRDIKPHNLMMGEDGKVKIMDWGVLKLNDPDAQKRSVTIQGKAVGTLGYIAPELREDGEAHQKEDGAVHDDYVKGDIYALGVTMYVLLGKGLVENADENKIDGEKIKDADPLSDKVHKLGAWGNDIIMKCIARVGKGSTGGSTGSKLTRYENMDSLISDLELLQKMMGTDISAHVSAGQEFMYAGKVDNARTAYKEAIQLCGGKYDPHGALTFKGPIQEKAQEPLLQLSRIAGYEAENAASKGDKARHLTELLMYTRLLKGAIDPANPLHEQIVMREARVTGELAPLKPYLTK